MVSILSKFQKFESYLGPAWTIGNWETIALAYRNELDS
jgi:hypothetical protein